MLQRELAANTAKMQLTKTEEEKRERTMNTTPTRAKTGQIFFVKLYSAHMTSG